MGTVYYDTGERLAEILGFTGVRRVQQLTKDRVLIKDTNGKYNIPDNVEKYFKFKLAGTANLELEKALHEKAKRELAEISLAKSRGEIHLASDVEMLLTGMLVNFRARMMALPQKLAPQIVGMETIAEIAGELDKAVTEALQELSDYNPAMFAEVHDATKDAGPVPEDTESGGPAAENDGERVGRQAQEAQPGERRGARPVEDKPRAVSAGNNGRSERPKDGKSGRGVQQPGGKKRDRK